MAGPQWKKAQKIESGNYPKSSFIGVLTALYPMEKDNGMMVIKADFKDEKTYDMQAIVKSNKAKTPDGIFGIHEDGTYDNFMASGKYIESIEALDALTGLPTTDATIKHIEVSFAFEDGILTGLKTEPDITGHKVHNVATLKQIGDDQQTSKYPDWTISQVEGLDKPTGLNAKPGKLPAKPKTKEPDSKKDPEAIAKRILDEGVEFQSIGDLYTHFKKEYKPGELREALGIIQG